MKGTTAFQLIHNLPAKELERLKFAVKPDANGPLMGQIIEAFRTADAYDGAALLHLLGTSKHKKNKLLDELGNLALRLIGSDDPEGKLMDAVVAVRKLVFQMHNAGAIPLWRWAMAEAERLEKFAVIRQLHELAWIVTTPLKFSAMSEEEALRKHQNYLGYLDLKSQLDRIKQPGCTADDRTRILQYVGQSPLLQSVDAAQSLRAQCAYWHLRASLGKYRRNYAEAAGPQRKLIALIQAHPWLKQSRDFFFTREMIVLSNYLAIAEDLSSAENIVFQVGNVESPERRTEWEKIAQLYPYRLQLALWRGDEDAGLAEITKIEAIIEAYPELDPRFVTRNRYFALYFFIAAGKIDAAARQAAVMRRKYSASDFIPWGYEFTRLLELVVLYEQGEWDDIPQKVKNFRKLREYKGNQFLKTATGMIARCSNAPTPEKVARLQGNYLQQLESIRAEKSGLFFSWFDLATWLESKRDGGTMLDRFRARALRENNVRRTAV
ncbi:MAG: hypothetical protein AAGN35_02700 [Bacteroidota bacterium]